MQSNRKWLIVGLVALAVALAAAEASVIFRGGGVAETVQGVATVPTNQMVQVTGVLMVQGRTINLTGLTPPREEPNCTVNRGVVVHCTLISAAKLAEMVAGKTIRCDLRHIGRDPRNWGVCRPVGSGAPAGNKIEDTINGQMLLTGWALPKEDHGKEWAALGIQARNAKAGLWAGYVVPDPVKVGTLYGVTEVNDGNTLEIQETRMRLYGIDAPDLGQECMLNGLPYQCGVVAYTHLIDLLAGKGRITCYASKLEGDDRPYAKCGLPTANGADIRADTPSFNEMMVRAGWALANRSHTNDYVAAEDEARKEKRGLWAGEFVNPSEWRNGKR